MYLGSWDFEFLTLRFCRCLTCLKQNALYGLLYCIAHICMTDMTSLIPFFLILFHYWAAFVVYQQNWVNSTAWNSETNIFSVNHIQVGSLRAAHGLGCKNARLPKICYTYPTMMKLSTVIPYLKKIQIIYKSCDTPIKFHWHQYFLTKNQQL